MIPMKMRFGASDIFGHRNFVDVEFCLTLFYFARHQFLFIHLFISKNELNVHKSNQQHNKVTKHLLLPA